MNYNHVRKIRSSDDWLVWRGEHPASATRYLIKQPQPDGDGPRLAERLGQEYAFWQPLEHPNLLRPRHWDPSVPCLVLDDVQGNLGQLIAQQGKLSAEQTAAILRQCLDGLSYLHERQLGHGSISLSTILIDPQGGVKFGDFLGYRFADGAPPPPDEPMKYQCPELLDSTLGDCGPSSDLYCLGHAALEMLLGEDYPLLFAGPGCSAADVQANWLGWHAHPGRELTALAESLPQVPPALLDILGKMIRKQPLQRGYRTAAEARQALLATGLASSLVLPELCDGPAPPPAIEEEPLPLVDKTPRMPAQPVSPVRGRSLTVKWRQGGQTHVRKFSPNQAVVVGCNPVCELQLDGKGVSRRHALLIYNGSRQWWVYDLHSTQGTWHNGTSIRAARLRQGDELRFGPVRCHVDVPAPQPKDDGKLGPFRLGQTIHQGSNGTLYRASWVDKSARPNVAVRVFPPDFQFDAEQIRRFLRGIPQAAAFRHPNILRLYRGGSVRKGSKRLWYLAMEHMAGGSLRDRLAQKGCLPLGEALRMAREVLQALRAIAEQRLLHRNLTPSCILFDEKDRVKVGDFVMMRGDQVESFQQITRAGSPPGEHIYQAPEVVQGSRDLTPAVDLYSLAVVLYEALTGQPPFPANLNLPETIEAILRQPIAPPRSLNPALPAAVDAFLLKALDKQPQRRFQSADEFEQQLLLLRCDLAPERLAP